MGLLLGVGLAFIRDHFDDGIRDEARLRDATSGRPVLGQIPHWSDDRTGRLATIIDPASPVSEAYRALSTNVRFMLAASRDDGSSESPGRVLLVSSASPLEGKTSVSGNLAVAAARVGLQVVLVDADLRHPMLSRSFGLYDSPGLSDVLASGDSAEDYLIDVGVPNLRLLAGGSIPPNPAELLASTAAASALRKLHDDADLLIVDSAPVLRVADALELMTTADLVLLVARRGISHMRAIAATVERINQAGGRVSGSVLNDIDSRTSAYTYGYHAPVTRTPTRPAEPALAGTVSAAPSSDAGLGILRDRYTAETRPTPGYGDTLDTEDQAVPDYNAGRDSSDGHDLGIDIEEDLEDNDSASVRESGDEVAHDAAADPDAAAPVPNGSDTMAARDDADPSSQKPHEVDSTASRPRSPRSAGQRR